MPPTVLRAHHGKAPYPPPACFLIPIYRGGGIEGGAFVQIDEQRQDPSHHLGHCKWSRYPIPERNSSVIISSDISPIIATLACSVEFLFFRALAIICGPLVFSRIQSRSASIEFIQALVRPSSSPFLIITGGSTSVLIILKQFTIESLLSLVNINLIIFLLLVAGANISALRLSPRGRTTALPLKLPSGFRIRFP